MARSRKTNVELVRDLVSANRILFKEGVLDGFGHVSARHDRNPGRFLLASGIAPGTVTAADIMEYDLDCNPVAARGRRMYLERYIHGEIYRARPDVQAVVHSHSPSVIPFGITATPLRPVYHMSGFLGGSPPPVFEIRDVGGLSTDLLIRDRHLGAALARSLGPAAYALMRGHGSVAVGDSVRQVVYRAIYAEMNARLQSEALRLGAVTFLTEGEAASAARTIDGVLERPWELWRQGVAKRR